MIRSELIQKLNADMERKLSFMPDRIRLWTREYGNGSKIPRGFILTGLRGCGKSTFLLYQAAKSKKRLLYFSADNPLVGSENFYELCADIFMSGYDGIIVDELHFTKQWSQNFKALYDDYPDRIIWGSDSSSLILRVGKADLSRRFVFDNMPLMSFRDFLFLETGKAYPRCEISAENIELPLKPTADILQLFEQYKSHGTRPFYADGNYEERTLAVLEKTIYSDVPFFVPQITDDNIRLMNAVIGTLASSAVPRVQVNSLCSDWKISADKLYQLLEVMDAVGLITIIRYENDHKAKTAGAKILFADPCIYSALNGHTGTKREAFVVMMTKNAGFLVECMRNEKDGDFVVSKGDKKYIYEVGGKNKEVKNADYLVRDMIDYPSGRILPLWLLAMSW